MKQLNLIYIAFITGLVVNIFKLPKNETMLLKPRITFPIMAVTFLGTNFQATISHYISTDAGPFHEAQGAERAAVEG